MGNNVPWSKDELEILLREYPKYGSKCPSLVGKRSTTAISIQARRRNIHKLVSHHWNEEDVSLLKREYPSKGTDIPELLSHYSTNAIKCKANALGLYRASIILAGVTYTTMKEVSEVYGIPYATLMSRIRSGKTIEEAISSERVPSVHVTRVVYEGVDFPSITAACRAAGVTTTAITAVRRTHPKLTAQEAFDKAVKMARASAKSIAKLYGLVPCSLAYADCDGVSHFFTYCPKCNVVLLMTAAQCRHYKHGNDCERFAIPKGVAIPYDFSRAVREKWGVQLPYPIYDL